MKHLPRATRSFIAAGALAAAALAVIAGLTLAGAGPAGAPPPAKLEGTDVWAAGTQPAHPFALRDQNGRLISTDGLHGQIWAVTFMDSHCTRQCPIEARAISTTERLLGSSYHLKVIVISVLPSYDTPHHIRVFARKTGMTGDWHWLNGPKAQMAKIWREYGILVITGVQHTAALYLVDRRGDVRVADAIPFLPSQLASSVRALSAHPRA
ncbi:MAG TPA: SCO family protein [Chloroflexota bacterium]|nr:SCO family protein [Chloroflexota bacterium]